MTDEPETRKEPSLECRMYENEYPEIDDVVMVQVNSIEEMGAYVSILEYNNIEGMILLSELSRRRIRSISKLIRVGRIECVLVLRVDKEKGYIDLSKRRVTEEDINQSNDRFQKSKAVHSIMRHTAELHHLDLETFYKAVGWPLYKKYGHAHEGFRIAVTKPDEVFEGLEIADDVRATLMKNIKRRLESNPFSIRADVEVTCFSYHGIGAIKDALRAGEALGTKKNPVQIRLVAAPVFSFVTTSTDEAEGKKIINTVIDKVREVITGYGGLVVVKQEPVGVKNDEKKKMLSLHSEFTAELAEQEAEEKAKESKKSKKKGRGGKKKKGGKGKKGKKP